MLEFSAAFSFRQIIKYYSKKDIIFLLTKANQQKQEYNAIASIKNNDEKIQEYYQKQIDILYPSKIKYQDENLLINL
jgi:hypothetical protein